MNALRGIRFAAAALLFVPAFAHAQGTAASARQPEIRSSGQGAVTVPADLAILTIQFSASARTPMAAGRAAATRANAIRAALIAIGIPRDSMPSNANRWGLRAQMNVNPNNPRDTTYVTNDAFTVRVRNLSLLGRVIDTAIAEGAQTISNIQFTLTNTQGANSRALQEATRLARANAEAMAVAAGGQLGDLIELSTEPQGYMEEAPMFARAAVGAFDESTTIVAPEVTVRVTVRGRWEFRGR